MLDDPILNDRKTLLTVQNVSILQWWSGKKLLKRCGDFYNKKKTLKSSLILISTPFEIFVHAYNKLNTQITNISGHLNNSV